MNHHDGRRRKRGDRRPVDPAPTWLPLVKLVTGLAVALVRLWFDAGGPHRMW